MVYHMTRLDVGYKVGRECGTTCFRIWMLPDAYDARAPVFAWPFNAEVHVGNPTNHVVTYVTHEERRLTASLSTVLGTTNLHFDFVGLAEHRVREERAQLLQQLLHVTVLGVIY